jgi:acyl-CoA dehydrogenase
MFFLAIYLLCLLILLHFNFFGIVVGCFTILYLLFLQFYTVALIVAVFSALFFIPFIRKYLISKPLLIILKKFNILPTISDTEKIALNAGTIWVEREFFKSRPQIKNILTEPFDEISKEERDFMENKVKTVCDMVSDFEVFENKDLPAEVWEYLKKNKFFGMIIPKSYGGLEFSANGQSAIVGKLGSRNQVISITTMVPNSLGPAELLLKYGTEKQKNYYLPRLADGREVPCFGLTEPFAGSDATSISSYGELFKDEDGTLKIKLNFEKRYITLGGIATIIGLAFQLKDPNNLLPKGAKTGITCALLKGDLPGIKKDRRHMPMHIPFINSPLHGKDVIISVEEDVIGGSSGLGEGWRMLMECLSVGRGISLPAIAAAAAKHSTKVTLMYSSLRKQFGVPVAKFEGIEEVLARMISNCYTIDAMRIFTATAVKNGHKPGIVNAIVKYHATEISRKVVNDGMDVLGGAAICVGPNNLIAHAYMGLPVAITVEGANIITRSLLQFGQGLIRCHPFIYNEMISIQNNDLKTFDVNFWGHAGSFIVKRVRAGTLRLVHFIKNLLPIKTSLTSTYILKMNLISARFGFFADLVLLLYGGSFKIREKLSGRFGDVVSNLYIMSSILRKYEFDNDANFKAIAEYSLEDCLSKIDKAMNEIYANLFHNSFVYSLIKVIFLLKKPSNLAKPVNDKISHEIVKVAVSNDKIFENLFSNTFNSQDENDRLYNLKKCFNNSNKAHIIIKKVKKAKMDYQSAMQSKLITKEDYDFIVTWEEEVKKIVQVDDFPLKSNAFSHKSLD